MNDWDRVASIVYSIKFAEPAGESHRVSNSCRSESSAVHLARHSITSVALSRSARQFN